MKRICCVCNLDLATAARVIIGSFTYCLAHDPWPRQDDERDDDGFYDWDEFNRATGYSTPAWNDC